ncbi:hypothetical protein ACQ4PT_071575 [Festuca glaucescens]
MSPSVGREKPLSAGSPPLWCGERPQPLLPLPCLLSGICRSGRPQTSLFDKRITNFVEDEFKREGIDLKKICRSVKVSHKTITVTSPATGDIAVSFGMAVW